MPKALAVFSGGMDSATLAYWLASKGYEVSLLSFYYGQRHHIELDHARQLAQHMNAPHHVAKLTLGGLLKGSALTDNIEVPEGHYAADNMKLTVVPNRNAMLLSAAFAVALGQGITTVAAGFHAGDHPIYPDCRPAFADAFQKMITTATEGLFDPILLTPFINSTKTEIAALGHDLGVPWEKTWSCYKGQIRHCGRCGTCVERREAFINAEIPDPTQYEDNGPLPEAPV